MADISQFVGSYAPVAQKVGAALGVDPNILLGQWGLETGWGKHVVPGTHNLGNIKGPGVAATDNQNGSNDQYRAYASPDQFGGDFANLIATHYPDAAGAGDDAQAYAMALKAGGYAEDPHYVNKLTSAADTVRQAGGVIDPNKVQWDDGGSGGTGIDASQVKWDDAAPAQAAAPAPAKRSTAQELVRQLGLTARAAGHGIADAAGVIGNPINAAINAGGELIGHNPHLQDVDTLLKQQIDKYTPAPENNTENIVGNVASTLANPIAMASGGAVGPAANVGEAIGKGALAGALGSASQPVHGTDTPKDLALRLLTGAAGGGAVGGAANAVGRVIGGVPITDAARRLMDRGITPTPGQAIGGAAAKIEEKAGSLPFLGEAQGAAQNQNINTFNRLLYQDALAPVRGQLPRDAATGTEALTSVHDQIGSEFNDIAQSVPQVRFGAQFVRDVNNIRQDLAQRAPDALDQFNSIYQNQIRNKFSNGNTLTGSQWGDSRSFLSGIARNNRLGNNTTPSDRALADAMDQLNDAMTNQVTRNTGPAIADRLANANSAYARYKQIERAAGSTGAFNNGNVITPAQFSQSVRQGSTAAQRAGVTNGLNRQMAQDAQQVLGRKVPDSGTAGRLLLNSVAGGGLGALGIHNPVAALGILTGVPLYGTQLGRQAMLTALARRPDLLQQIGGGIAGNAPLMGLLGGSSMSQPTGQ